MTKSRAYKLFKKNYKTIVKVCEINSYNLNGNYTTLDKRYNVKYPIIKVIKKCLEYCFSFKVGFSKNMRINNMNYIEITTNWFGAEDLIKRNELYEKHKDLCSWLEMGKNRK